MNHFDIINVLRLGNDKERIQSYIGESDFFNPKILSFHEEALGIWRSVARCYAVKEKDFKVPYGLAETAKLYALDALCLSTPLITKKGDLQKLAEFFTVFYLMVHFFDDHVEHRDKFYSKFDFSNNSDIDTQRGAAPFSFTLVSFSIIFDILSSIDALSDTDKLTIITKIYSVLGKQTRYFASERQSSMSIEDTLEVKQRQVSGKTLALFGDVLAIYLKLNEAKTQQLHNGLIYLGSMTQITDDIRDRQIDTMLRNANIINTADKLGTTAAEIALDKIYQKEAFHASEHLKHVYDEDYIAILLSLPFYPFMINKRKLKENS